MTVSVTPCALHETELWRCRFNAAFTVGTTVALRRRRIDETTTTTGESDMRLVIIILLVLLLLGALPTWPYSAGWGYYPSSGLGLLLLIIIILALLGRV